MPHSGACITHDKDASTEIMQSQFRSVVATGSALATLAPHVLSHTNTEVTVNAYDLPKAVRGASATVRTTTRVTHIRTTQWKLAC